MQLELKACRHGLLTVVVSENPVLKADAIKYLMVFRNQVSSVVALMKMLSVFV